MLDRLRALAIDTPAALSPGYIRTVREALGFTQAQFAQRLGKSTVTIKKWEAGTLRPGAQAVRKVADLVDRSGREGVVLAG